jgi:hypothetical protein
MLLPLGADAQSDSTVPIEKVVFFKSGVSYVEHRGTVQDTETTTLRFSREQMADVLKSLVVQDLDGGRIGSISYPSKDPLRRTLEGFPLTDDPEGLGTLINNVRGGALQASTPGGPVQGTAVSAERRDGPNGAERWYLNLYSDGTLRSVSFDSIQALQFEDPQLQDRLRTALDAMADARNDDNNPVELRFQGTGTRRVRVGYVVKAPVWKTSYRLLLPDENEGDGQLQGWAIVENQTDADWSGVDLTLVSGRPVSFVQDLYTPTYVDRPVVSTTAAPPLKPALYQEGMSASRRSQIEVGGSTSRLDAQSIGGVVRDATTGDPLPGASVTLSEAEKGDSANQQGRYEIRNVSPGSYTVEVSFVGYQSANRTIEKEDSALRVDASLRPAPQARQEVTTTGYGEDVSFNASLKLNETPDSENMDPTEGVSAAATAAEAGAFFQYHVGDVSLDRRQSAMLPIVTAPIEVERLSIYDPSLHKRHPLHGARLENTTERHLAAGPVTVLNEGSYAGDARLGDVPPGDTRFVTYALNQDVQVNTGGGRTEETVQTGTIVEGVLTMTRKRVATQTYTIENEAETDVSLVVEHPRRDGWTLAAPSDVEERTASDYRLRTTVNAGNTRQLIVQESKALTRRHQLLGTERDQLLSYARTGALPDDVRDALEEAAELQRAVAQAKQKLSQARQELDRLRSEQSRIRENMKAVEQSSDYYQRLLDKLSSTEDRIESLNERIATLEEERVEHSDRLGQYLQDLTID